MKYCRQKAKLGRMHRSEKSSRYSDPMKLTLQVEKIIFLQTFRNAEKEKLILLITDNVIFLEHANDALCPLPYQSTF